MKLAERTVIVTGGGSGLGRAIAHRFAAEGAQVLAADIDGKAAAHVAAEIKAAGGRAEGLPVDVTDGSALEAMVAQALSNNGAIDILVNSAGIGEQTPFLEQAPAEFERIIAINLTGTYRAIKAVAPQMVTQRYGRIINLSSVAGLLSVSGRVGYGASKSGVIGLTRQVALELAPYDITVNAIAPGPVETPMAARVHTAATRESYTRTIMLARYGTPEEIAAGALYLASEDAGYVTGHTLPIDGGMSNTAAIFALG